MYAWEMKNSVYFPGYQFLLQGFFLSLGQGKMASHQNYKGTVEGGGARES